VSEVSERSIQTTTGAEVPAPRGPAAVQPVPAEAEAPVAPTGDPSIIGLPAFLAGAVALGLVDINFAPVAAAGAAVPIIMTATSLGLFIAAIWAARLAQNAVAAVMAIFGGFWLSFAALALGLQASWFAVLPEGVARTVEVFLITWLVVIGLLTLGTLRLPLTYTLLFVLVDIALLVTLIATVEASVSLTKTAGWIVLAFTAVGAYLFLSSLSVATGGKPYPLGRPLLR
jgi:succinate-acetate transporter protein